jgi:hypothetical protein
LIYWVQYKDQTVSPDSDEALRNLLHILDAATLPDVDAATSEARAQEALELIQRREDPEDGVDITLPDGYIVNISGEGGF